MFPPCLRRSGSGSHASFCTPSVRTWPCGHTQLPWKPEREPSRAVVCVTITEGGGDCLVSAADSVEETV